MRFKPGSSTAFSVPALSGAASASASTSASASGLGTITESADDDHAELDDVAIATLCSVLSSIDVTSAPPIGCFDDLIDDDVVEAGQSELQRAYEAYKGGGGSGAEQSGKMVAAAGGSGGPSQSATVNTVMFVPQAAQRGAFVFTLPFVTQSWILSLHGRYLC